VEQEADYEVEMLRAVDAIRKSEPEVSLGQLEELLARYPNSKLGYLLLGDLLAARAGSPDLITRFAAGSQQLHGLRDELRHRWRSITGGTPAAQGKIPANLILSAPGERYVLAADASHARLYVFENTSSGYRLVEDFFMTIGKAGMGKLVQGDFRTPEGVYFVTSYLPGEGLPPRYGPGAFPINYPNEYDRKLNRTGYGIWIHGTEPENHNRVPLASDGCLSLSNEEFNRIRRYIRTDGSTPVIISRSFRWIDQSTRADLLSDATRLLHNWESAWESLDTDRYLAHYSPTEFENFGQFAIHKQQVNRYKRFVDVELRNLSIYAYPGNEDMLLVSFDQDYRSDNYNSRVRKRQYWKRAHNRWQIVHEIQPVNLARQNGTARNY
jgi:murein L,D-transpeptidase YafK